MFLWRCSKYMTLIRKVAASSSSLSWTFDCGGEGDREGVRVGELRMDRLPHAYQLTRPAVPLALDAADGVGAVVDDVVDDLAAGAEGEEAPLSRLAAGGLDGHALRARVIHDREVVVEAVEDVLHVAAALAVGVQDVHLGSVQTED